MQIARDASAYAVLSLRRTAPSLPQDRAPLNPHAMPAPFRLTLALALGALAALGFAPLHWWPLTIIAAAGLIALLALARTRRGAFATGWAFGLGNFTVGLAWIATAFEFQDAMPAWVGWPTVVLLSMYLALWPGLAGLLGHGVKAPVARVPAFGAAWMLAEWLRGWVLSGFAWNPLGAAWLDAGGVGQGASLVGAVGLSGLLVLAGGAVWLGWRYNRLTAALTFGAVCGFAVLSGLLVPAPVPATGPMLHIVQPNIGQEDRWNPGAAELHLRRQLVLTARALPPGHPPALVMWSESAVQGLVEEEPGLRARLAGALGPRDVLLFGGIAVTRGAGGNATAATNSLFGIDSSGRLLGRYDKAHLVPLGEYVPAHDLMTRLGLARLTPGDLGFQAGPGPRTLALPGFPDVGVQICYEIVFPGEVVDRAHRPAWLLQPSNDSWYGPWMQPQHLDQARLRAIEEGLPVARATPNGTSALIDARGRVLGALGPRRLGVISARLPAALAPTPFARFGHWTTFAFGLLLLAASLWPSRRRI